MASNDIRMRVLLNVDGKKTVAEVSSSVKELQNNLRAAKSESDKANESLNKLVNFTRLASGVQMGIQSLTAAMQPFIDKANNAVVVQTKLKTVMEQRMGATAQDVAAVNKLVTAQTQLGVIGGTVQRSALQQVATFASSRQTLETLLPAMNNLIAQQKGLNATSEDAVTIANMVGKALMGNSGAMTRVGITLTDTQKKIIQTGNEGQRAAAIAQAITDNVGQMNKRLAQTDAGKVKQMANDFAGVQVKIGSFFAPYQDILAGAGQLGMAVSGIAALGSAVTGLWKAFGLATVSSKVFAIAQASFAAMGELVTATITGQTLSLAALRRGIMGTIASLGLVGMAYMALSSVVGIVAEKTGLFGDATDKATDATRNLTSSQREAAMQSERMKKARDVEAESVGEVVGKYQTLQSEWKNLKTKSDQTAWIKKNQDAFRALGLSIGDVAAAQRVFVTNAPAVTNALKAIAVADAYKEEYAKAMVAKAKASSYKTVANGGYSLTSKGGQEITTTQIRAAGLKEGTDYTVKKRETANYYGDDWAGRDKNWKPSYQLTEAGADRLNRYRQQNAGQRWESYMTPYDKDADMWSKLVDSSFKDAERGRALLSGLGSPYGGATGNITGSHGSVGGGGAEDNRDAISKELDNNNDKIEKLSHEWINATEDRKKSIEGEISKLKERNKTIEDGIAAAKGETAVKVEAGSKTDLENQLSQLQQLQDGTVAGSQKWVEYGQQVESVKAKLDALESPETATSVGGMSKSGIDAWRGMKQEELANTDIGTESGMTAAVRIVADMDSMTTLQQTVEEALAQGLTLPADAVEGLYESIFGVDGIPQDKIESWVEAINAELEKHGLGKIELKTDKNGTNTLSKGGEEAKASWQDAARAVQSVGGALSGLEDPAAKVAGTIAQAIAEIALSFASALNRPESKAGGVWGWIAAAAVGTATMISTIASIKGATRHAGGGIVGGNTPSGDLQPVLLNSGELILNKAQQGAVAAQLQESRGATVGKPYVTGEEIWLGLSNYLRRRGYGEIVTTR